MPTISSAESWVLYIIKIIFLTRAHILIILII